MLKATSAPRVVDLGNLPDNTTCLEIGAYDEGADSFTCEIHDPSPSAGYADLQLPAVVLSLMVGVYNRSDLEGSRWFLTQS